MGGANVALFHSCAAASDFRVNQPFKTNQRRRERMLFISHLLITCSLCTGSQRLRSFPFDWLFRLVFSAVDSVSEGFRLDCLTVTEEPVRETRSSKGFFNIAKNKFPSFSADDEKAPGNALWLMKSKVPGLVEVAGSLSTG